LFAHNLTGMRLTDRLLDRSATGLILYMEDIHTNNESKAAIKYEAEFCKYFEYLN
jgi:hypothetical protein